MNITGIKKGPFLRDKNTTNKMMFHLLVALVPIILFAFYKNGIIPYSEKSVGLFGLFYPLIFIFIATLTSFLTETLYALFFLKKKNEDLKNYIKYSFSIFPGLFLSLVVPINTPISILILGSFCASLVGKMLFGGFGKNIFNPALIGTLFITSTYSLVIANNGGYLNAFELDTLSTATPLSNLKTVESIGTYESLVRPYGSLKDFFVGTIPGTLGEVSALLCIIAFFYLAFNKVIKWKIPVVYVLTVFIMTYIIGEMNDLGIWYPMFQILSGGLMFGAIFMATDPVTSPTTPIGQIIYGLFLGILTVIFRYLTPYPEGVLTAILTMNMFVFIIDKIGFKSRFDIHNSIKAFVFAWMAIIAISVYVAGGYKITSNVDINFKILEKKMNDSTVTYVVTQKGYVGNIKAKITISNNVVESFEILEQNESFFSKVSNEDYINKLIKNQNNLSTLDTVSGATVTSNSLKKMLINTMNDFKRGSNKEIDNNDKTEDSKQTDFKIIGVETVNNKQIYNISKKGFSGNILLAVTISENKIEDIEVLESNDSYMNKVLESNFIDELIDNQSTIDDVDTVSGATVSSSAIKTAIINLLNSYEEYKNEQ